MHRLARSIPGIALALMSAGVAGAQQRRTASPGGGAAVELPNIPANPRFPFAGAWVGRLGMPDDTIPIAMIIEVGDGKYTGGTVWPNGARAPHLGSAVTGDELTWQQTNSGGGMWHYRLKRTGLDTLVGSMTLRDAPNFPPPLPTGSITLIRNPAQASRQP